MKLIAGSLLIVASAILFLARIHAEQPMNGELFNWAIQLASRCGLVLSVLGSGFIAWGMGEEALGIVKKDKSGKGTNLKKKASRVHSWQSRRFDWLGCDFLAGFYAFTPG